jgi:hypothetical protein
MHRTPEVSRPAWMKAFSPNSDAVRRSPVEIVANMASYVTRMHVRQMLGQFAS